MSSYPSPGWSMTSEYQASGVPFVTSSSVTTTPSLVSFPMVTKFFTVEALNAPVRFGFSQNGVAGTNYFQVPTSQSMTFDLRVKELWIVSAAGTANYSLLAGMTFIRPEKAPTLTGSYVFDPADPAHTGSNAYVNVAVWDGIG